MSPIFNHPIYLAAFSVSLILLLVFWGVLLKKSPKEEWRLLLVIFLIELPMFFVSTYGIRVPLNGWINQWVDPQSHLGLFIRSFQAPIVEESCKLWLIGLVFLLGRLKPQNALRIGMTVGFAFGISEIWGLAYKFSQDPRFFGYPWYYFSGFMQERFLVAPIHGVFAVVAARKMGKGFKAALAGILTGMLLHYFANFPIFVSKLNIGNLTLQTWQIILSIYIPLYTVLMYGVLLFICYGKPSLKVLTARYAHCPKCQKDYKRPHLRVNLGPFATRETCPHCKQKNWIQGKDLLDNDSSQVG